MTYDRILSHKLYKSNYFKSTLQKCLPQEGVAGVGSLSAAGASGVPAVDGLYNPFADSAEGIKARQKQIAAVAEWGAAAFAVAGYGRGRMVSVQCPLSGSVDIKLVDVNDPNLVVRLAKGIEDVQEKDVREAVLAWQEAKGAAGAAAETAAGTAAAASAGSAPAAGSAAGASAGATHHAAGASAATDVEDPQGAVPADAVPPGAVAAPAAAGGAAAAPGGGAVAAAAAAAAAPPPAAPPPEPSREAVLLNSWRNEFSRGSTWIEDGL